MKLGEEGCPVAAPSARTTCPPAPARPRRPAVPALGGGHALSPQMGGRAPCPTSHAQDGDARGCRRLSRRAPSRASPHAHPEAGTQPGSCALQPPEPPAACRCHGLRTPFPADWPAQRVLHLYLHVTTEAGGVPNCHSCLQSPPCQLEQGPLEQGRAAAPRHCHPAVPPETPSGDHPVPLRETCSQTRTASHVPRCEEPRAPYGK